MECEALGSFLSRVRSLGCPCSRCGACSVPLPGVSRGRHRRSPQGRNGLSAWRMAVLSPFRERSLCRHVHGELLRSTLLDLTSYNVRNCLLPKKLRREIQ